MQPSAAGGAATQGRGASSASASVPGSNSSNRENGNGNSDAALKGATLAFRAQNTKAAGGDRPTPRQQNPMMNRMDNGALRAATQAARERPISRPRSPAGSRKDLSRQVTGGSLSMEADHYSRDLEHGLVVQRLSQHLGPPGTPDARPSASYIAATLAASRTDSPTPNPSGFAHSPLSATQLHSRVTRRSSLGASSVVSDAPLLDHMPDAEPIQPTGSLISLFESKREAVDVDPVKNPDPARRQQRTTTPSPSVQESGEQRQGLKPKLKPKPPPSVVVRAATFKEAEELEARPWAAKRSPHPSPKSTVDIRVGDDTNRVADEGSLAGRPGSQFKNKANPQVASREPHITSKADSTKKREKREATPPPTHDARRPVTELVSPEPRRIMKTPKLEPPELPIRNATASKRAVLRRTLSQSSASSDDSFVSASSTQSPRAMSPVKDRDPPSIPYRNAASPLQRSTQATSSPLHPSSSPSSRPTAITRRLTSPNTSSNFNTNSNLALGSLTDAIVASNLASARLAIQSSSPVPPPIPAPRQHRHRPRSPQYLQPQRTADSLQRDRTGGSNKSLSGRQQDSKQRIGMLRTLRAPHSSLSDDEDARRRTHRTRKKTMHPLSGGKKHAHKEGSRRRWRDEVSARERRRYEAVWASNRGLFLRPGWALGADDSDEDGRAPENTTNAGLVANVVVRDLWSRSRLPLDELAEVWDLVDKTHDGTLGREEFVVGMWLIDQRLKGSKIPARVGESVWASVRGGNVPFPKRK